MNVNNTSAIKSSVGNLTTSTDQNIYAIEKLTLIIKSIMCISIDVIMYIILGKQGGTTSVIKIGKKARPEHVHKLSKFCYNQCFNYITKIMIYNTDIYFK